MDKLIEQGRALGYADKELQTWVKEQQAIEREDRARAREQADKDRAFKAEQAEKEREIERLKVEQADKDRAYQLEKEREIERIKAEQADKDRAYQLEKEREQAEKEREIEKLRIAQADKDREFEMEKLKMQTLFEQERLEVEVKVAQEKTEKATRAKDPKLPYFDEQKDKMDSYISRFEKYAVANKWNADRWAINLSALLKGRALEVYDRLSNEDANDYDKLKEALLKNFDMTERGFRKKFRLSKPDKSETFTQFSSRLGSYFTKWLSLANISKTFEAVCDFMVRDQFLESCSRELYVHLKPKEFTCMADMAKEADLFAEARGGVSNCVSKGQRENRDPQPNKPSTGKPSGTPQIKCSICGKGHFTYKCFKNPNRKPVYSAEIGATANVDSDSKAKESNVNASAETQEKPKESQFIPRGRGYPRGRGSNRGSFRGRGRPDATPRGGGHQVSFCKTETSNRFSDGIESVYQSKIDSPLNLDKKDGVCYFLKSRLPTAQGLVNGKKVVVLRDTGCTGCVIRRNLVSDDQLLGKESDVTLIDETTQSYPLAMIDVDCPFFTGQTEALCMDDTLYDLDIGNIDGFRICRIFRPQPLLGLKQSKAKQSEGTYKKLKVPDQIISDDKEALKRAQDTDEKLVNIRRRVEAGDTTVSRGLNRGETKFVKKGFDISGIH